VPTGQVVQNRVSALEVRERLDSAQGGGSWEEGERCSGTFPCCAVRRRNLGRRNSGDAKSQKSVEWDASDSEEDQRKSSLGQKESGVQVNRQKSSCGSRERVHGGGVRENPPDWNTRMGQGGCTAALRKKMIDELADCHQVYTTP